MPVEPMAPNTNAPDRGDATAIHQRIFDALPLGVVVFDARLRIRTANVTARAILPEAADAPALLEAICTDGPCVDWRSELSDVWQKRMTRRFDAVAAQSAGSGVSERYLDIVIRPLGDADAAGIILIDDVTGRISMQRRLAISERMATMGKLAARVAHELNNPLDGILRYANLALRRLGSHGDEKVADYIGRIRAGSTRMSGIVRDLLTFSRSHADTERETTLNHIVGEAIDAMTSQASDQSVTIRFDATEADSVVDRGAGLFQVFCNLIKNAIDAMPDGGTISIATSESGRQRVVRVDDEGPGLPDTEKVFEPFYTTKPEGKGTGLGLAVCREILESYGGSIAAENRPEGGARLTVTLPPARAKE
jgi:signal transduction histidine kinase